MAGVRRAGLAPGLAVRPSRPNRAHGVGGDVRSVRSHRGGRGAGPLPDAAAHGGAAFPVGLDDRRRRHRPGDGPVGPASGTTSPPTSARRRPPRLVELTVSYRTPSEVVAVAARVLAVAAPGIVPPRPVRRVRLPARIIRDVPARARGPGGRRRPPGASADRGRPGGGAGACRHPPGAGPDPRDAGLDPVDPGDPAGTGLGAPLVVLPADEANGLEFDSVTSSSRRWWPPWATARRRGPPGDDHPGAADPAIPIRARRTARAPARRTARRSTCADLGILVRHRRRAPVSVVGASCIPVD